MIRAGDVLPADTNWKQHPPEQRAAMRAMLNELGIVDVQIARDTPDGPRLVDGHMRADIYDPDQEVPVIIVDLDDNEAAQALVTIDPLAGMAVTNAEPLSQLLASIQTRTQEAAEFLRNVARDTAIQAHARQASTSFLDEFLTKPDATSHDTPEIGTDGYYRLAFTVTEQQRDVILAAVTRAKAAGADTSGDALTVIAQNYP